MYYGKTASDVVLKEGYFISDGKCACQEMFQIIFKINKL